MAQKPAVDRLESEIGDKVKFALVDLFSDTGRVLAQRYNFTYTPFFVLFDKNGTLVVSVRGVTPTRGFVEDRLK